MSDMPKIKFTTVQNALTPEEFKIAQLCFNVSKDGWMTLKASKPTIKKGASEVVVETTKKAMYVWRMVAFQISPNSQHQCMPMMAYCDLPETPLRKGKKYLELTDEERLACFEERRALEKSLDALADKIVKSVPPTEWHGVLRWARALGYR